MAYQTATDKSGAQASSLMPEVGFQRQVGPTAFVMGNTYGQRPGFRTSTNDISGKNVGFPEVDLPFLMQRPHYVKSTVWTTSQAVGTELFSISGTDMIGVSTLAAVLNFQALYRFNPVLEITMAASTTAVGALLMYWVPVDINFTGWDVDYALMFPHEIVQPYKQASGVLKGYFQRAFRYNGIGSNEIGTFKVVIYNALGGPSATAAANSITVSAFLNFEDMSLRIPSSPSTSLVRLDMLSDDHKRRLMEEWTRVVRKGDEIQADSSGSSMTAVVERPVVVVDSDTVEEKATDFKGVEQSLAVGGHNTRYRGYLTSAHDDLKLSLQRFAFLGQAPSDPANVFPTTSSTITVFAMTVDDMVKCLRPAAQYYCWSGGLRLKWLHNADVSVKAIVSVKSLGCEQRFHLRDCTEKTIVIPYWCLVSTRFVWGKLSSYPSVDRVNTVTVTITGQVFAGFVMQFFLATADDFVLQVPIPIATEKDLEKMEWRVAPLLYDGVAPTNDAYCIERKGLQDIVNDVENFAMGAVSMVGSAARGVAGVVDTVAGFAQDAGAVLGLFDKPDAFQNDEWNVVDHAVPVVRMQYCSTDYVCHDETVSCDNRGIDMMKVSKLLQIPLRINTFQWTTAKNAGDTLAAYDVALKSHGLWALTNIYCPQAWRGSIRYRFEFVKNVFHKGVVVAAFSSIFGEGPKTTNYTDFYNVVFDISKGDSFEMVIPYCFNTDYLATSETLGTITILVLNTLVAQNTTTTIDVNTLFSAGDDLELRIPKSPSLVVANLSLTKDRSGPYAPATPPAKRKRVKVRVECDKPPKVSSDEDFEELEPPIFRCGLEQAPLVVTRFKKKQRVSHTVADEDFLVSCGLRNQVVQDLTPEVEMKKVKALCVTSAFDELSHHHVHTDHTCFRLSCPSTWSQGLVESSISHAVAREPKIPTVEVKVKKRTNHVSAVVRYFQEGRDRFVVFRKDKALVRAVIGKHSVWDVVDSVLNQDFPIERKGGLVTKMGEKLGEGAKKSVFNESVKSTVKDFEKKVRSVVDEVDEECLNLVVAVAALKVPAYAFQLSSVNDWKGFVGVILHLLADIMAAVRSYKLLTNFFTDLVARVPEIVCAFCAPCFCGENGEEDKTIWKIVKSVVRPYCGKMWSSFASFSQAMKPFSLIGSAVKGLTAVVDFFRALVQWFGFCLTNKKNSLKETQEWLKRNSSQLESDMKKMKQFVVTGNIHALATDVAAFEEVKKLASRAIDYRRRLCDIWNEPTVRGNVDLITQFLRKVQELPNDPLSHDGFEPVFVLLEGAAGLGKSTLSVKMARTFAKALTGDESRIYRVSIDADYWTGCADQQVYVIDDLFQDPSGLGVAKLTQLISTVGCAIPKADIQGKFGLSQAKIVIGSSNSALPTVGSMTDPTALVRRYKETHFTVVGKGLFKKVSHGEDGKKYFSEEMSENEVCDCVQRHFESKWKVHLERLKARALDCRPSLVKLMNVNRREALEVHAAQVGSVDPPSAGYNPFDEDEDEIITMKGNTIELVDPREDAKVRFWRQLAQIEDGEIHDFLRETVKDFDDSLLGPNELRYKYLDVPFRVERVNGDFVFENLGTCFSSWNFSFDMSDERNRFALFVAYKWLEGIKDVECAIKKQGKPTIGVRVKMFMDCVVHTLTEFVACITCCIGLGVVLVSGGILFYAMKDPQPKGAYDTRPAVRARERTIRAEFPQVTQKGFVESRGVIEKSILGWCVVNSRGTRTTVHCLSVGQGYVLVNSHAVIIGMQHYITYKEGGYNRVVPVHVSDGTMVEFTCGDATVLDLVLVWIGSTIPLRKGILNHFVSQNQSEMLNEFDAVALFERSDNVISVSGRMKWEAQVVVRRSNLGEELKQKCYTGPIYVQNGDCGSPLVAVGGSVDGKIVGITSAGSVVKGVFLPVTLESLKEGMALLGESVNDSVLPVGDSALVEMCGREEVFDVFEPYGCSFKTNIETPKENPQFTPVSDDDTTSAVSLKTKILRTNVFDNMLQVDSKAVSVCNMHNAEKKIYFAGTRFGDGTVFENSVPSADFDSGRLEMAVQSVSRLWSRSIGECRVYTESEVLNRIELVDSKYDLVEESNPVQASSASGHYLDVAHGKKPRKYWITENETGARRYGSILRHQIDKMEESLISGVFPKSVAEMHYKDELRPLSKTSKGRCRIFFVGDLALWCLQKKYFGHFATRFRAMHGFQGKHSIGCDPVKFWNSWGSVFSQQRLLCGDVSGWDTSVTGWHLELVRRIVEGFYPQATPEETLVRKLLIDGAVWTQCVMDTHNFVVSGLKSGMFATTEFNSVLHVLVVAYGLLRWCLPSEILEWPFLVCGDDSIISTPPGVEDVVEGFVQSYKELGFNLTGSNKEEVKICTIADAVFLKRKFSAQFSPKGWFYAPQIDRTTIRALLEYKRKVVPFEENWRNALVFCRQGWDTDMFAWVNFVGWKVDRLTPLTWYEAEQLYEPHRDEIAVEEETKWWMFCGADKFQCQWPEYVGFRIVLHKKIPVDTEELFVHMVQGCVLVSFVLADQVGLEHIVFTFMRRALQKYNIYIVGDLEKLCCLWWIFCFYEEPDVADTLIWRKPAEKIMGEDIEAQVDIMTKMPWVKSLRKMNPRLTVQKHLEMLPVAQEMVWMAIYHAIVLMQPDFEGSISDVVFWFADSGLTPVPTLDLQQTERLDEDYNLHPARLVGMGYDERDMPDTMMQSEWFEEGSRAEKMRLWRGESPSFVTRYEAGSFGSSFSDISPSSGSDSENEQV
uniref:Genome polyprotein n=1 Tax=Red panda picorna-like virus TaxID=2864000 RepID=A0A8K1M5C2_9VIRU|nr:polyprotein [Red panda picorna-like virus]